MCLQQSVLQVLPPEPMGNLGNTGFQNIGGLECTTNTELSKSYIIKKQNYGLLRCNTVQYGRQLSLFWRHLLCPENALDCSTENRKSKFPEQYWYLTTTCGVIKQLPDRFHLSITSTLYFPINVVPFEIISLGLYTVSSTTVLLFKALFETQQVCLTVLLQLW